MKNASKEKALAALLTCNTVEDAARRAGLSAKTLYTYLQDEAFKQRYEDGKAGLLKEATEMMQRNLHPTIAALRDVIDSEDTPPGVRVQACRAMLDYTLKLTEVNDLDERLKALEGTMVAQYGVCTSAKRIY